MHDLLAGLQASVTHRVQNFCLHKKPLITFCFFILLPLAVPSVSAIDRAGPDRIQPRIAPSFITLWILNEASVGLRLTIAVPAVEAPFTRPRPTVSLISNNTPQSAQPAQTLASPGPDPTLIRSTALYPYQYHRNQAQQRRRPRQQLVAEGRSGVITAAISINSRGLFLHGFDGSFVPMASFATPQGQLAVSALVFSFLHSPF